MSAPQKDLFQLKQIVGPSFLEEASEFAKTESSLSTWYSIGTILFDYLVIAVVVFFGLRLDSNWYYLPAAFLIAGRQHGLMILIHEAVHGLLSPHKKINVFLAEFFCAFPLFIFFKGYRANHLAHHQFLNTDADPDWKRKDKSQWVFPTTAAGLLKMFGLDIFFRFPRDRFKRIMNLLFSKKHSHGFRLFVFSYYATALFFIFHFNIFNLFLLYWILPLWFALPAIFLVRSVAEHFGLTYQTILTSSRNVRSHFFNQIFIPHQANYHLTHHLYPFAPWYRLKKISNYLTQNKDYAENAEIVDGYLFGQKTLLKQVLNKK